MTITIIITIIIAIQVFNEEGLIRYNSLSRGSSNIQDRQAKVQSRTHTIYAID